MIYRSSACLYVVDCLENYIFPLEWLYIIKKKWLNSQVEAFTFFFWQKKIGDDKIYQCKSLYHQHYDLSAAQTLEIGNCIWTREADWTFSLSLSAPKFHVLSPRIHFNTHSKRLEAHHHPLLHESISQLIYH